MQSIVMKLALALAFFVTASLAEPARSEPKPAPEWEVSEWLNSDGVRLADLRGQVVVIDFFQLWCPGCNSFSVPLMHHWERLFAEDVTATRIQFISIHTVFEGHDYQTPKRLRRYVKEKGITHPVGIDRHEAGQRLPVTMRRYGTRGTPEMAIIDKKGRIRFQRFGFFEPSEGEALIRRLLAETEAASRNN